MWSSFRSDLRNDEIFDLQSSLTHQEVDDAERHFKFVQCMILLCT